MIEPQRRTIEDILTGSRSKFSVPQYQRNFDWGENELQELMDDLKDIKESENKSLFLGNFIFDVSEKNNYKIVDGQQRLTTISIILIALREHAKKINEKGITSDLQGFISINSALRKKKENKISVSNNIKDIFEYISNIEWDGKFPQKIGDKSVKRQVNKIKPIFNYILENFSEYNKEDLQTFTEALLDAYVIVVSVETDEDVFSIFERTNARGLDLNIGDLLKNYIFAHGIEEFEERWNEIIFNAENSLQRMLKYFWISRKGYIQQSNLYKALKKYATEIGIEKFVNELYSFSRYYKMVQSLDADDVKDWLNEIGLEKLANNEDYSTRINRVFQALKLFRVTQAYPLIYSILKFYKEDGCDSYKNLFKVLESIENYHFVNNVVSGRIGNEVEKFYAEKSKIFFNYEKDFTKIMIDFVKTLKKKKVPQDDFISNFIESITYNQKNLSLINYIFDRINNFGTKGSQRVDIYSPEKNLKTRNYNIEHILPQSKKKEFEKDDELDMFDRIGNLLVISRHSNSEFIDKDPIEKIKMINSDPKHYSNLRYLTDFLDHYKDDFENWDFEKIEKRSKEIARQGYKNIWNF